MIPSHRMMMVNAVLAGALLAFILGGCAYVTDTKYVHHGKEDGGSILWNPHEQHTVSDSDGP